MNYIVYSIQGGASRPGFCRVFHIQTKKWNLYAR